METHTQVSLRYDVSHIMHIEFSLLSPASYFEGPSSIRGQPIWSFEWTEGHWDRVLSEYFGLSLSVLFQQCYTLIFKVTSVLWLP